MSRNIDNFIVRFSGFGSGFLLGFLALLSPLSVNAEGPMVTLRIADEEKTILNTNIAAPVGCEIVDSAGTAHAFVSSTALCILDAAKEQGLLTYEVTDFGFGLFLDTINGTHTASDWSKSWIFRLNTALSDTGLDQTLVQNGDEVLLAYGPWDMDPLLLSASTTTIQRGESFTLTPFRWSDETSQFELFTATTTIVFSTGETVSTAGVFVWTPATLGEITVVVTALGTVPSSLLAIQIVPPPEPRLMSLRIEAASTTVLLTDISLPESCAVVDSASTTHTFTNYRAICALQKAKEDSFLTFQVTNWGFAFALDQINDIANAPDWSETWLIYQNLLDPGMGIDGFSLNTLDELLLTYGPWPSLPFALELSTSTVKINNTVTLSFGTKQLDASALLPINGTTTVWFNEEFIHTTSSTLLWEPKTAETVALFIESPGMTRSKKKIVAVQSQTAEALSFSQSPQQPTSGSGNLFAPLELKPKNTLNLDAAISFLIQQQNTDGSFGFSPLYTDWAAIALGSARSATSSLPFDNALQKTADYLKTDPNADVGPNTVTNAARRSMALLALGLNPQSSLPTNYIQKMLLGFDGTQFGDPALVNDDIFALFPLVKTGLAMDDIRIKNTVGFLIEKQDANGSWGSVDLTAAGVQALSMVKELSNAGAAIEKAMAYLKVNQQGDGGFGNVYSASWALQAIAAHGQNESLWTTTLAETPSTFLGNAQAADGGLLLNESLDNRVWATSYAIPAALKKPWGVFLVSFPSSETSAPPAPTNASSSFGQGGSPESVEERESGEDHQLEIEDRERMTRGENEEIEDRRLEKTTNETSDDVGLLISDQLLVLERGRVEPASKPDPSVTSTLTEKTEPLTSATVIAPAQKNRIVPIQKTARGVFAGATTLAGSLGLYLAWRFVQTMV